MIVRSAICVGVVLVFCAVSTAQQAASAAGTGTVSGHVTASDTQRPARFANVILYGVPGEVTPAKKVDPSADMAGQVAAMAEAMKSLGKTSMVQLQSSTDGGFFATDVAPGDYYVFATAPGYITPPNRIQALLQAGVDLKQRLSGVPVVHVTADHLATADVTMERGAAVSGTILWDDGSPVAGASMAVIPAKAAAEAPAQFRMLAMSGILSSLMNISDDQGHFRLSGLPPGDYLLQATIQAGQQSGLGSAMNMNKLMGYKPLVVFAPASFHKATARAMTLRSGEELRDQQITLNLGTVHSVSGRIASIEDHHGINAGTVKLQDENDKDFLRSASLDSAGGFTVTFVPPGTYTMKVTDAEDTEAAPKTAKNKDRSNLFGVETKTVRAYQDGKLAVIVGDTDVTGQNVELTVDKNPKTGPDFSKMFSSDDDKPAQTPHPQ